MKKYLSYVHTLELMKNSLIKQVASSNRKVNWPLQVPSVKESMPFVMQTGIFRYWRLHIQICLGGSPWDCSLSKIVQARSMLWL